MYQEPMYLHTVAPKTADLFIGRLREIEKIQIRMANEGALEHLRQTVFLADNISPEVMAEVKVRLMEDFAKLSAAPWWEKQVWNN